MSNIIIMMSDWDTENRVWNYYKRKMNWESFDFARVPRKCYHWNTIARWHHSRSPAPQTAERHSDWLGRSLEFWPSFIRMKKRSAVEGWVHYFMRRQFRQWRRFANLEAVAKVASIGRSSDRSLWYYCKGICLSELLSRWINSWGASL